MRFLAKRISCTVNYYKVHSNQYQLYLYRKLKQGSCLKYHPYMVNAGELLNIGYLDLFLAAKATYMTIQGHTMTKTSIQSQCTYIHNQLLIKATAN